MNTTNTIFPNIGNNNRKCYDSMKDSYSKTSSGISKSVSATDKQESTAFILQDSRSSTEHHEINGSQHHRKVHSKDPETYLTQPDCHRPASHGGLDDNIKCCNTEHIPAPREWPSCTETVKGFFTSLIPPMKAEASKSFRWEPKPIVIATSLLHLYTPCWGFMATLFCTLVGHTKVAEARVENRGETNSPRPDTAELTNTARENITTNSTDSLSKRASIHNKIEINDIGMLEKIGVEDDFPRNGNYELTADLDGSSFKKPILFFTGNLNGMNHTISNMTCNLISEIHDGIVRNLIISNANIIENKMCPASIACTVEGHSLISNVQIKDSHIQSARHHQSHHTSGIVSYLSGTSQIENSLVKNCSFVVKMHVDVGGLVATMAETSISTNNTVDGCSFHIMEGSSYSGCLFGSARGRISSTNDKVFNCSITASEAQSLIGGVMGFVHYPEQIEIKNVTVSDSKFKADGIYSGVGIMLGGVDAYAHASIIGSTAINSIAIAMQEGSHAGIWLGQPSKKLQLYNNTAINCTVEEPAPTPAPAPGPAPETTANLTTTEPAMVVDGASYLPLGLLLTGATVATTVIGAAYFAGSLYNGFQAGKRGRSLATHPFIPFVTLLTNCYHQCFSGTTQEEDDLPPSYELRERMLPPLPPSSSSLPPYELTEMMEMLPPPAYDTLEYTF